MAKGICASNLCQSHNLLLHYSGQVLTIGYRRDNFYAPDDGAVVTLLCGPPGLIEKGAIPGLEKIGFEQGKNIFGF